MNPVLETKLDELEKARDYECWYLVKQTTEFDVLCYLVSFLKKYRSSDRSKDLTAFFGEELSKLNTVKPQLNISNNYRALRVALYYGLIRMTGSKYESAEVTEVFEEITARCGGEYEKTELYSDIVKRQIEKMFISSQVDEERNGVRRDYRLYPVMLLYKVLLELGRATGSFSISMAEYRYLVATTKKYGDFLDTLLLIRLLREDTGTVKRDIEKYKSKFDNRMILALRQLDTLTIDKSSVALREDRISEAAEKVYIFEQNPDVFDTEDYLGFLCSGRSLLELKRSGAPEDNKSTAERYKDKKRPASGTNVLLYGVPGSGKSWTIEHEYRKRGSKVVRLVFYPDYTYSDFIGQLLPSVAENGQVSYVFTPGPFTSVMRDAYNDPENEYLLIIEEINRGNAPAIFGEVFQLLDRKTELRESGDDGFPVGTSEYGIVNTDIAAVMYGRDRAGDEIRIPSNLSVIGTMNTSDQNVFTLDTAFQRRWNMRLVENSFDDVPPVFADAEILDTGITWRSFCTEVNKFVTDNGAVMAASEDKRLGVYFVRSGDLWYDNRMGALSSGEYDGLRKKESAGGISDNERARLAEIREAMKHNRVFPEKVIKYLWDDAFKFDRDIIFESGTYRSLEQVIHAFMYAEGAERFKIFKETVRNGLRGREEK